MLTSEIVSPTHGNQCYLRPNNARYLAEIKPLIDSQVSKVQNGGFDGIEKIAIMLVGGGSLIPYIHEVLKDEYTSPGIEVTQHDDNKYVPPAVLLLPC